MAMGKPLPTEGLSLLATARNGFSGLRPPSRMPPFRAQASWLSATLFACRFPSLARVASFLGGTPPLRGVPPKPPSPPPGGRSQGAQRRDLTRQGMSPWSGGIFPPHMGRCAPRPFRRGPLDAGRCLIEREGGGCQEGPPAGIGVPLSRGSALEHMPSLIRDPFLLPNWT